MRQSKKILLLWILLLIVFVALWRVFDTGQPAANHDRLAADAEAKRVVSLRIQPEGDHARAEVLLRDGKRYAAGGDTVTELVELAYGSEIPFTVEVPRSSFTWTMLTWLIPVAFLILLYFFLANRLGGAKNPTVEGMVNARIEVQQPPPPPQLAGLETARQQLVAAAAALQAGNPGPRKILLSGPPGTGKTTLVSWLAAEAGIRRIVIPASDIANVFVGVAAARVRRMLELAQASGPCLLVIEDVDAIAARRPPPGAPETGRPGPQEQEQALIELCNHLDGVRTFPAKVIFIATTNRPDRLDEAFVRPGRIDLHLRLSPGGGSEVVPPPEEPGSLAATAT